MHPMTFRGVRLSTVLVKCCTGRQPAVWSTALPHAIALFSPLARPSRHRFDNLHVKMLRLERCLKSSQRVAVNGLTRGGADTLYVCTYLTRCGVKGIRLTCLTCNLTDPSTREASRQDQDSLWPMPHATRYMKWTFMQARSSGKKNRDQDQDRSDGRPSRGPATLLPLQLDLK